MNTMKPSVSCHRALRAIVVIVQEPSARDSEVHLRDLREPLLRESAGGCREQLMTGVPGDALDLELAEEQRAPARFDGQRKATQAPATFFRTKSNPLPRSTRATTPQPTETLSIACSCTRARR